MCDTNIVSSGTLAELKLSIGGHNNIISMNCVSRGKTPLKLYDEKVKLMDNKNGEELYSDILIQSRGKKEKWGETIKYIKGDELVEGAFHMS